MQGLTDAEAGLECDPSSARATRITLKDKDTGELVTFETCWSYVDPICDNLNALSEGYTPNDWSDECE